MAESLFPQGLDAALGEMARRLVADWAEQEVEVLMGAEAVLVHLRESAEHGAEHCLSLMVPAGVLARIEPRRAQIEARLLDCARELLPPPLRPKLASVGLCQRGRRRDWRADAREWLRGGGLASLPELPQTAPQRLLEVIVAVPQESVGRAPQELKGVRETADADEPAGRERYRWIRVRG